MKKLEKRKVKNLIYLFMGGLIYISLLLLTLKNIYIFCLYFGISFVLLIYGLYEGNSVIIRDLIIYSEKVSKDLENLNIIFFTDIQMDYFFTNSKKKIRKIIKLINKENPDIILFGGDYINKARGTETVLDELKNLSAKIGIYTVYGNHDYYDFKELSAGIKKLGIVELKNRNIKINYGGKNIILAGIDDYLRGKVDEKMTFLGIEDDFTIFLCHNPDYFELMPAKYRTKVDLTLSGHTHGGQINLFGFTPFSSSKYKNKYRYGLKEFDGNKIYISSGLGGVMLPFRFLARPEIVRVKISRDLGGDF